MLSTVETADEKALGWKPIEDSNMKWREPLEEAAAFNSDSVCMESSLPSILAETISAIVEGLV